MHLDIIAAAQLSDEDARALKALNEAVYPPKPGADKAPAPQRWAHPQWRIMIHDAERQLVSHVGVLTRKCLCDGAEILIGGIRGVETHPAQRRQGYAGAGLRRAIEFLRNELRVDLALLFCEAHMVTYYKRFGFSSFAGDTYVLREGEKILVPRGEVMLRPVAKALPPCMTLDLCGLPW